MAGKANPTKRIAPTFTDEEYAQIEHIAKREGRSLSEVVRMLAKEALDLHIASENIDFITKIVREEVRNAQQPGIDRLASLAAKSCIMSATATYLSAETISRLLPADKRLPYKEAYDSARAKAVQYVRSSYREPNDGE